MRRVAFFSVLALTIGIGYYDLNEKLTNQKAGVSHEVVTAQVVTPVAVSKVREISAMETKSFEDAESYFKKNAEKWGIQQYHEHQAVEFRTPIGQKVKYTFSQDGVPIIGMDIQVYIGRDGEVRNVENTYVPLEKVDITSHSLGILELGEKVKDRFEVVNSNTTVPPVLYLRDGKNAELAYLVSARDKLTKNKTVDVLLRATDGLVLQKSYSRSEF